MVIIGVSIFVGVFQNKLGAIICLWQYTYNSQQLSYYGLFQFQSD